MGLTNQFGLNIVSENTNEVTIVSSKMEKKGKTFPYGTGDGDGM